MPPKPQLHSEAPHKALYQTLVGTHIGTYNGTLFLLFNIATRIL